MGIKEEVKQALRKATLEKNEGRSRYFLHLDLEEQFEVIDEVFA